MFQAPLARCSHRTSRRRRRRRWEATKRQAGCSMVGRRRNRMLRRSGAVKWEHLQLRAAAAGSELLLPPSYLCFLCCCADVACVNCECGVYLARLSAG
jgi:hypothetical protein